MIDIRAPWVNVLAAIVGGLALGIGIGRMIVDFTLLAGVWAIIGFLLLWWALSDRRTSQPGTPESEQDGSHTIE
jgi:hypothetical protein